MKPILFTKAILLGKGTEGLANWGDHPHAQKGKQEWINQLPGDISP